MIMMELLTGIRRTLDSGLDDIRQQCVNIQEILIMSRGK
jgi:hypothetical protein